jgi:hypothetical protein
MRDARAIYELMVLSVWADGRVLPDEVLAVQRLVASDPDLSRLANRSELSRAIKDRIGAEGLDAVVREKAAGVGPEDREIAFRLCAKVLRSDGEMAGEDAGLLGTLQELFGFSADAVSRILRER